MLDTKRAIEAVAMIFRPKMSAWVAIMSIAAFCYGQTEETQSQLLEDVNADKTNDVIDLESELEDRISELDNANEGALRLYCANLLRKNHKLKLENSALKRRLKSTHKRKATTVHRRPMALMDAVEEPTERLYASGKAVLSTIPLREWPKAGVDFSSSAAAHLTDICRNAVVGKQFNSKADFHYAFNNTVRAYASEFQYKQQVFKVRIIAHIDGKWRNRVISTKRGKRVELRGEISDVTINHTGGRRVGFPYRDSDINSKNMTGSHFKPNVQRLEIEIKNARLR